jgi:hypothetical protein
MIGVGHLHLVRSVLPATRTRRTRSLYKIWHGDTLDDYERAVADFEAVDGTALVFDSLCTCNYNEQQVIRCHMSQPCEHTTCRVGPCDTVTTQIDQVAHVKVNIA